MDSFNSKEYTFCDVQVIAFGKPFCTLQGITYKMAKAKKAIRGAGGKIRAIQHGSRTPEGKFEIFQSDLIALNKMAKDKGHKDCLDLDFDLIISYGDSVITVDKVVAASIMDYEKALKQEDLEMPVSLPWIAIDIEDDITI